MFQSGGGGPMDGCVTRNVSVGRGTVGWVCGGPTPLPDKNHILVLRIVYLTEMPDLENILHLLGQQGGYISLVLIVEWF